MVRLQFGGCCFLLLLDDYDCDGSCVVATEQQTSSTLTFGETSGCLMTVDDVKRDSELRSCLAAMVLL